MITQERLEPRPLAEAPRDGTMVFVLVDYSNELFGHPLEDANKAWTIGFENFDNTGEDGWQFVGWKWSQDCFQDGRGKVLGWAPMPSLEAEEDDDHHVECRGCNEEHPEGVLEAGLCPACVDHMDEEAA